MLYKYPRTPHLPWSPGVTRDDRVLKDISHFIGQEIVMSLKMDGECSTLYRDYIHARSVGSKDHEARHWLKNFWAGKKYLIPKGWRVCGEDMYAKHSIYYKDLESYLLVFSIWDESNVCLHYDMETEFCMENGFTQVREVFRGEWRDEQFFNSLFMENYPDHEGYVIRLAGEFKYEDFDRSVAKYVRQGHVQTDEHWMYQKVIPNKLRK